MVCASNSKFDHSIIVPFPAIAPIVPLSKVSCLKCVQHLFMAGFYTLMRSWLHESESRHLYNKQLPHGATNNFLEL